MYVHGGANHGSGRIKLIDFGTACKFSGANSEQLDQIYGSPNYMAPEVLKKKYDFKCDVWSIGIICTTLITGKMPFEAAGDK